MVRWEWDHGATLIRTNDVGGLLVTWIVGPTVPATDVIGSFDLLPSMADGLT